jgi:hypothetical protein
MTLTTVVVRWTGPFSFDEVCASEKRNGLYLLTGKQKYERREEIQYCGITEGRFCDRINAKHHKLDQIRSDTLAVWFGTVIYPRRSQRRHLEIAEHCIVSFWDMPLNEKKKYYPRRYPVCFISQWHTRTDQPRTNRPAILKGFPDVMWWDLDRWRSGRLRVWHPGE